MVFLDIDGVLNRFKFNYDEEIDNTLDEKCISRLNRIIEKTGSKIVISSSWKASAHLMDILEEELFPKLSKGSVIGCTPTIMPQVDREHEIRKYMESNDIENYVILDDYDFELKSLLNEGHCVITDALSGLSDSDADKAIDILNSNSSRNDIK